jgi:hypothetical protein
MAADACFYDGAVGGVGVEGFEECHIGSH